MDGYGFLSLSRAPVGEKLLTGDAVLLVGWNLSFAGFSSRLAGAALYHGILLGSPQALSSRFSTFTFVLDEAWLRYPFEGFSWKPAIQAGWFRWRSHADAALAGEFLTRRGGYSAAPYPSEYRWEALDSLTAVLTGLRFTLDSPARRFRQEAMFLLDTMGPEPGLSFLWSTHFTLFPGIETGFAFELDRLLEPKGSHSSDFQRNRYYVSRDPLADSGQVVTVSLDSIGVTYYTIDSRRFSARLTLDPIMLFTGRSRPDRGGRFFLEAALLGWENALYYYEDRIHRLHYNAGIHLPAFGFLDVLRLQADLWPEPPRWNSLVEIYERTPTLPIPGSAGADTARYRTSNPLPETRGWRMQLYLSRALLPWLDVQARLMRERSSRYGSADFRLVTGPRPVETGAWTTFDLRLTARL